MKRALALPLVVALLLAVACSDDGSPSGSLTNACGTATESIACEGNDVPAVTPRTTVPVPLTPIVLADAAVFDGVVADGLTLGDANAPVQIHVYTNFLCGHCADFANEILPPLVTAYATSGQAVFTFHHAPLGGAPAIRAHEASQCAADQGRFWQASAQLFTNFSQQGAAYSDDRLGAMMANAGVDVAAFDECLADGDHREEIEAAVVAFGDVQRIPGAGFAAATATTQGRQLLPVVLINERSIVAPTLDEMRAIIEEELP